MTYWIGEHADLVTLSGEGRPYSTPTPDPLTPQQQSRAAIAAFATLIAFGCTLCTAVLLAFTAWFTYRLHDTLTTWPHTQAEVLHTEVYSQRIDATRPYSQSPRPTVYGFRSQVSYSVASHPYQSPVDIGYQKSDPSDLSSWSSRIHPGDRIEIAYSPVDPTHIRFAGDFLTAYAPALLLLRWVAWLVAIGALAAIISRKLRPQVEEQRFSAA
jgi:Protein of unknown function (DUF3592)